MLRATCAYSGQRKTIPGRVEALSLAMKMGHFSAGTSIHICCFSDGTMFIVNGNHTLEAIASSGVTTLLNFVYVPVTTAAEVAAHYNRHDVNAGKTAGNALMAGLPGACATDKLAYKALGLVANNFTGLKMSAVAKSVDLRFASMGEYVKARALLAEWYPNIAKGNRAMLHRLPVVAVALVTAEFQSPAARSFWSAVVGDDGLRVGSPAKALLAYLRATDSKTDKATVCKAVSMCWNAHFRSGSLKEVSLNELPIQIKGTPWHAGAIDMSPAMPVLAKIAANLNQSVEYGSDMTHDGFTATARYVRSSDDYRAFAA